MFSLIRARISSVLFHMKALHPVIILTGMKASTGFLLRDQCLLESNKLTMVIGKSSNEKVCLFLLFADADLSE